MMRLSTNAASLKSEVTELRKDLADVKARLGILEAESAEFRKVALGYIISEVHKKIEASLGGKPKGQLWSDYLQDKYDSNRDWFRQRQLGLAEVGLLIKGPNTEYEAGNDAAHRPDTAVVNRLIGEEGGESWRRLWKVASS